MAEQQAVINAAQTEIAKTTVARDDLAAEIAAIGSEIGQAAKEFKTLAKEWQELEAEADTTKKGRKALATAKKAAADANIRLEELKLLRARKRIDRAAQSHARGIAVRAVKRAHATLDSFTDAPSGDVEEMDLGTEEEDTADDSDDTSPAPAEPVAKVLKINSGSRKAKPVAMKKCDNKKK